MAAERWLPPPRWGQCFLPFLFVVEEKETAVTSWIPILSTVTEILSVVNPGFTLVKWTHLLYKQKSFKTDIAIAANTWNYLNTHWKEDFMRAWSRTFLESTWLVSRAWVWLIEPSSASNHFNAISKTSVAIKCKQKDSLQIIIRAGEANLLQIFLNNFQTMSTLEKNLDSDLKLK